MARAVHIAVADTLGLWAQLDIKAAAMPHPLQPAHTHTTPRNTGMHQPGTPHITPPTPPTCCLPHACTSASCFAPNECTSQHFYHSLSLFITLCHFLVNTPPARAAVRLAKLYLQTLGSGPCRCLPRQHTAGCHDGSAQGPAGHSGRLCAHPGHGTHAGKWKCDMWQCNTRHDGNACEP